jgi:hypothetical protein
MTNPRNFSPATRRLAFSRCQGRCELCGCKLTDGLTRYDHRIPWEISRDSSLSNAACLCRTCHDAKTYQTDLPAIVKARHRFDRMIGIRPIASRPMPGGRNSGFKKTMRGEVVARFNLGQMLRQMGLVR